MNNLHLDFYTVCIKDLAICHVGPHPGPIAQDDTYHSTGGCTFARDGLTFEQKIIAMLMDCITSMELGCDPKQVLEEFRKIHGFKTIYEATPSNGFLSAAIDHAKQSLRNLTSGAGIKALD